MNLDKKAAELKTAGKAYCLATVVKVEGSAPRHVGAKMIVDEDGGAHGTVGGGGLEHQAIEDAKGVLRRKGAECIGYDLSKDGIQPCGGRVEIFFEPVTPLMPAVVFGAGHVSEKLCPMLAWLGYEITLVDERKERLEIPAFGAVHRKVGALPSEFLPTLKFSDDLNIICLTHKHIHDEEIVEYCLDKPYRYLGLISSRKKWAHFRGHYEAKGFTQKQMGRVSTPVGLDIGAETPFEIAVAIAAELIQLQARPDDFAKGVGRFRKGDA